MTAGKALGTAAAVVVGFIGFVLFVSSFTTVSSGEKAVVLHWGAYEGKTLEPGLHWLNPVSESAVLMDTTIVKEQATAAAATKDQQSVTAEIAVNYRLDSAKAGEVYVDLKTDAADRVVRPSIQEAVKAATAKYTAEELITKRGQVSDDISTNISTKLAERNLLVVGVNIVNLSFSDTFDASIEAKVKAEQDALAAKNKLEQTKYEAEQQIVAAKAQAESIRIQAEAIQSQGGADYVQLQAIAKWNGQLPTSFIPGSTVPFLNVR